MLAASWLSLAVLDPTAPAARTARLGYFLGSLFAHPTLAAAWAVFGPGRSIVRVTLSMAWMLSLPAAIAINIAVHGGPSGAAFTLGACLVGQWLLLLFPFAAVVSGFGLRIRRTTEVEDGAEGQRLRFGIRDLMIVIAICSVAFGLGRIIVPTISMRAGNELYIFVFLTVAAVVMTFPLLLAALCPGSAWSLLIHAMYRINWPTTRSYPREIFNSMTRISPFESTARISMNRPPTGNSMPLIPSSSYSVKPGSMNCLISQLISSNVVSLSLNVLSEKPIIEADRRSTNFIGFGNDLVEQFTQVQSGSLLSNIDLLLLIAADENAPKVSPTTLTSFGNPNEL